MIISLGNKYKSFFDVWILILVGYSCFSSLFYVAFTRPTNPYHKSFDFIVECHFYMDFILSFFTEYQDEETNINVNDIKLIVKKYL